MTCDNASLTVEAPSQTKADGKTRVFSQFADGGDDAAGLNQVRLRHQRAPIRQMTSSPKTWRRDRLGSVQIRHAGGRNRQTFLEDKAEANRKFG
ncbi:hypothetical protein AX760_13315 [Pararhizobium antarcticum]|uniref:Uncharacterized protein n=1 Tax=Pararhizobium antarcticum TaxID=1798805 RepID=A0A657LV67_9HYPH|nr:hypothetical protein AX761_12680 [Rhizobium sp. 58]OJF99195.1 hypothetical protein AX760_13315 [Pararhizobium antarcticum]